MRAGDARRLDRADRFDLIRETIERTYVEPTHPLLRARSDPVERQRVLMITRNLPPLIGGMERLNWYMAQELQKVADVRVVGPEGAAALAPADVDINEVPLKPLWRFLIQSAFSGLRAARRWRPQVVLAGSGLTAPMALLAARSCGACAAVYTHGLDLAVQSRIYRAFWIPAIRRMDVVIVNSEATRDLALTAGVAPGKIQLVHPGVALPKVLPTADSVAQWRGKWGDLTGPYLLSVGRLTERKGLRQFVADILPALVEQYPNLALIVVGGAPTNSLHGAPQTPDSIIEVATAKGVRRNVKFAGWIVSEEELSVVFSAADLHVFPVRHLPDDPEGFGMVAIEAAVYGLATVAYATGGVPDAVAAGVSGSLVPPDDAPAFAMAILETLRNPMDKARIRNHAARFAWPEFGQRVADAVCAPMGKDATDGRK